MDDAQRHLFWTSIDSVFSMFCWIKIILFMNSSASIATKFDKKKHQPYNGVVCVVGKESRERRAPTILRLSFVGTKNYYNHKLFEIWTFIMIIIEVTNFRFFYAKWWRQWSKQSGGKSRPERKKWIKVYSDQAKDCILKRSANSLCLPTHNVAQDPWHWNCNRIICT